MIFSQQNLCFFSIFFVLSLQVYGQGLLTISDATQGIVEVSIKENPSKKGDFVELCRIGSDTCLLSEISLGPDPNSDIFTAVIKNLLVGYNGWSDIHPYTQTLDFQSDALRIYNVYTTSNISNTINELQNTSRAGAIQVSDKEIVITTSRDKCKKFSRPIQLNKSTSQDIKTKRIKINSIALTISDNFITNLYLDLSTLSGNEKIEKARIRNSFSISLNDIGAVLFKINILDTNYYLCLGEVIEFLPDAITGAYSSIVQDIEVLAFAGEKIQLNKRSIDDYLGIAIGSDFLGLNDNNINSALVTSIEATLPLNNKNYKSIRLLEQFSTSLSFAVLNGEKNESSSVKSLPFNVPTLPDTGFVVNYFDLVRFQNATLNFDLSILSVELKRLNTIAQFGFGVNVFRSGVKTVEVKNGEDLVKDFNFIVGSIPKYFANFKYQPDLRFGAVAKFEYKFFRPLIQNRESNFLFVDDDPIDNFGNLTFDLEEDLNEITDDYFAFDINLYGQVGKKSGVFASFLAEFNGLGKGAEIFPRLLVGYSTNIANYVNKPSKN